MPTSNYKFTYIDDAARIDIAGDTKAFLDEIDATIKSNADAVQREIDDAFPIGADDIQPGSIGSDKLVDGSVTTSKLADGAVTAGKIADGALSSGSIAFADNSVDARFLRDGTVTAEKLSDTGLDALVGGITVRRFSTLDSQADNVGMNKVGATGWRVQGFYIPAFRICVVTQFEKLAEGSWGGTGLKLPSYVPLPDSDINIGYATRYDSSSDYKSWAYMTYKTSGYIEASTQSDSDGYIAPGAFAFRIPGNSNTATLRAYEDANGVI